MKNYFEHILETLQDFAEKKAEAHATKEEIIKNASLSQIGKEQKCNDVEAALRMYGERCNTKTVSEFDKVLAAIEKNNEHCEMADMSGLFSYITSSGKKCNIDILKQQIRPFRGNFSMMQAVSDVIENSDAMSHCKQFVKDYIFNYKAEIENAKYECSRVYTSNLSASIEAKKIVKLAELLGVELETKVNDEISNNAMLRAAFGLK